MAPVTLLLAFVSVHRTALAAENPSPAPSISTLGAYFGSWSTATDDYVQDEEGSEENDDYCAFDIVSSEEESASEAMRTDEPSADRFELQEDSPFRAVGEVAGEVSLLASSPAFSSVESGAIDENDSVEVTEVSLLVSFSERLQLSPSIAGVLLAIVVLLPLLWNSLKRQQPNTREIESQAKEMLRGVEPIETSAPKMRLPKDVRRRLQPVLKEFSRHMNWMRHQRRQFRRWRTGPQGDGLQSMYSKMSPGGPRTYRRRSDVSYRPLAESMADTAKFSLHALSQWTVFGGQELHLLERLARSAVEEHRPAGDVLFTAAQEMHDLYIVREGCVALVAPTKDLFGLPGVRKGPGASGAPGGDFVANVTGGGVVASMLTLLSFLTGETAEAPVTAKCLEPSVILRIPAYDIIHEYLQIADKKVLGWLLRKLMMRVNRVTLMTMYGYLGIIYNIQRQPRQRGLPDVLTNGFFPENGLLNAPQTDAVYDLVREVVGIGAHVTLPTLELLVPSEETGAGSSPKEFVSTPRANSERASIGRSQSLDNVEALAQALRRPRRQRSNSLSFSGSWRSSPDHQFFEGLDVQMFESAANEAPATSKRTLSSLRGRARSIPLPYADPAGSQDAPESSELDTVLPRSVALASGTTMQLMFVPADRNVVEMDSFADPAFYIVVRGELVVKSVQEQPLVFNRGRMRATDFARHDRKRRQDAHDPSDRIRRRSHSAGTVDDLLERPGRQRRARVESGLMHEDPDLSEALNTHEQGTSPPLSLWSLGGLGSWVLGGVVPAEPKVHSGTKEEGLITVHGPGTMVGQLSLLTDSSVDWYGARNRVAERFQPRPMLSIRSSKDSWLVRIGRQANDSLIDKSPEIVQKAARRLTEDLPDVLKVFDFGCKWVVLDAGDNLHKQRQECTGDIHVVLHGNLKVTMETVENRGPFVAQVESGEVETASASRPQTRTRVLAHLSRGSLAGESEILTGTPYTSTVTATRHCSLARIPGSLLVYIMKSYPTVYAHLAQHVSKKMASALNAGNTDPVLEGGGVPGTSSAKSVSKVASEPAVEDFCRTIFIVPISPSVPHDNFCQTLCQALSRLGLRVQLVTSAEAAAAVGLGFGAEVWKTEDVHRAAEAYLSVSGWLNQREELNDIVLYQADWSTGSQWNHICSSCADRTLFVVNAADPPGMMPLEQDLDIDEAHAMLIMLHVFQKLKPPEGYAPQRTRRWIENREKIHSHHHIRLHAQNPRFDKEHHRSDFARLGRILTGRAVGLVLGGGGARGMAHLSVIRVLEEENIPIDMVAGSSIGSLIGALYASSPDYFSVRRRAHGFCMRMSNLWHYIADLTWPSTSWFSGLGFNAGIYQFLGKHTKIEDLWLNFSCATTDLTTGNAMVHRNGTLWRYVRASMSLAGYLPPLCDEDPQTGILHYLVDGGYVNVLPADVMRTEMGASTVIAVDVFGEWNFGGFNYGDMLNGFRVLLSRFNPFGKGMKVPSMAEISEHLAWVASQRTMDEVRERHIDLYLSPPVGKYSTLAFSHYPEIESIGYEYAKPIVKAWKASVVRAGGDAATSIASRPKS